MWFITYPTAAWASGSARPERAAVATVAERVGIRAEQTFFARQDVTERPLRWPTTAADPQDHVDRRTLAFAGAIDAGSAEQPGAAGARRR